MRGFANSLGQRNWFESHPFSLNVCAPIDEQSALKLRYAGLEWSAELFEQKVQELDEQRSAVAHKRMDLSGPCRAYLAPQAFARIVEVVGHFGFGIESFHTKQSPLLPVYEGERVLNDAITISERVQGVAPNFNENGFLRPQSMTLIDTGRWRDWLVSTRSAREYGVPCNGANGRETPMATDVSPGGIET